jgi:uncharacterized protein with von Willebrand factor type A (vWA) domain
MTNPDYTAIAILMDRSGSMSLIRNDAQGAVNAYIEDQRNQPGKCTVRLSQFDTEYENVYPSTNIEDVPDYVLSPRGGTALTDSIAKTVLEFGDELADLDENDRPGTVVVVIVTDGEENSSREYTADAVKAVIKEQQEKYNWQFVFLAAGQDAIKTGAGYGIGAGSSLTFTAGNINSAVMAASNYTTTTRSGLVYQFTDDDRETAVDSDASV